MNRRASWAQKNPPVGKPAGQNTTRIVVGKVTGEVTRVSWVKLGELDESECAGTRVGILNSVKNTQVASGILLCIGAASTGIRHAVYK